MWSETIRAIFGSRKGSTSDCETAVRKTPYIAENKSVSESRMILFDGGILASGVHLVPSFMWLEGK